MKVYIVIRYEFGGPQFVIDSVFADKHDAQAYVEARSLNASYDIEEHELNSNCCDQCEAGDSDPDGDDSEEGSEFVATPNQFASLGINDVSPLLILGADGFTLNFKTSE